jgi:hypothetical protein
MALGPVISDYLTDLIVTHGRDKTGSPPDDQQKTGENGPSRAEGNVPEDIKAPEESMQRIEKMIEHEVRLWLRFQLDITVSGRPVDFGSGRNFTLMKLKIL